jgi:hypothetical protein
MEITIYNFCKLKTQKYCVFLNKNSIWTSVQADDASASPRIDATISTT